VADERLDDGALLLLAASGDSQKLKDSLDLDGSVRAAGDDVLDRLDVLVYQALDLAAVLTLNIEVHLRLVVLIRSDGLEG